MLSEAVEFLERGARRFPDDGEMAWDLGASLAYELVPRVDDPEEKERLHEQWAGRKQLPQAQIRRKDFMRVREEARDRDRGIDPAAEQAAAKADRKEMVRAIMTLKKRKVPARILDKERKNLIREMESRRLQRKKERERASKEPQQAQAEALTPLS